MNRLFEMTIVVLVITSIITIIVSVIKYISLSDDMYIYDDILETKVCAAKKSRRTQIYNIVISITFILIMYFISKYI